MSPPTSANTLPGPLRQFVGIETEICGYTGVALARGVNVRLAVRVPLGAKVPVGGSDVVVGVGEAVSEAGSRVPAARAVCVRPAMIVCAAAVLMAEGSCKLMAGRTQAETASVNMSIIQ